MGTKKTSQSDIIGLNASVDITVDKDAELTMIIDKTTGDFVKVKGTANLNGGIDASGKTNLTGKYEIEEEQYEMTFSSIKKKFDIKKGSYHFMERRTYGSRYQYYRGVQSDYCAYRLGVKPNW